MIINIVGVARAELHERTERFERGAGSLRVLWGSKHEALRREASGRNGVLEEVVRAARQGRDARRNRWWTKTVNGPSLGDHLREVTERDERRSGKSLNESCRMGIMHNPKMLTGLLGYGGDYRIGAMC